MKYLQSGALRGSRDRSLVSIKVTVRPVLDLSDPSIRDYFDVTELDIAGDDNHSLETCRRIADWARAEKYHAIRAPSAAISGEDVLAIYLEGPASDLEMKVLSEEPLTSELITDVIDHR